MWVALADGPDDDDDDMGTEEGVGVKSPFFMRSNMVACSAANSSNSWDRDDGDWLYQY